MDGVCMAVELKASAMAASPSFRFPPRVLSPPSSLHSAADDAAATTRARLRRLCNEGHLAAARNLLENKLSSHGGGGGHAATETTTVLWNTLLIAYVNRSLPSDALRLYTRMNDAAIPSDAFTYSSALAACARSRRLLHGRSIHCQLLRRFTIGRRTVLWNSLLNMYAACGAGGTARTLFDVMPVRNAVSWNTLIKFCARSGWPRSALRLLCRMLEKGIAPTAVTFVSSFLAAAAAGGRRMTHSLYSMLIKYGSDYVDDPHAIGSAISAFTAIGDLDAARLVFDRAAVKNIEVWNALMTGYIQNGEFTEAICLFLRILEEDNAAVAADTVTFLSALSAASHLQDIALGRNLHAFLVKQRLAPQPVSLTNSLIVMYSRCGDLHNASELFNQMGERDLVSWNTMVTTFVHHSMYDEGLMLVYEMKQAGFSIDHVTITALLSIASNKRDIVLGRQTHGYIIRQALQFEGMESYLIDMYSEAGHVEVAQCLFDSIGLGKRDNATWNALIAGYVQNGLAHQAFAVFCEMLKQEVQPNSVTLSSVLPACEPIRGLHIGRQIHGFAMRHGLNANIFVDTALVDMYSKCGNIVTAEQVFNGMGEKSTVTYTAMISGLGQHGLGSEALTLFYSMLDSGVEPDGLTFLAVISACSFSGLVDEGLSVHDLMAELGIVATPEHHCCIVDLLSRAGRLEDAYEFVQSLENDNGNSFKVWGSLLGACRAYCQLELGKLVYKRLLEIDEYHENAADYNAMMSSLYAMGSDWSNVEEVWREHRELGHRKKPAYSYIAVES